MGDLLSTAVLTTTLHRNAQGPTTTTTLSPPLTPTDVLDMFVETKHLSKIGRVPRKTDVFAAFKKAHHQASSTCAVPKGSGASTCAVPIDTYQMDEDTGIIVQEDLDGKDFRVDNTFLRAFQAGLGDPFGVADPVGLMMKNREAVMKMPEFATWDITLPTANKVSINLEADVRSRSGVKGLTDSIVNTLMLQFDQNRPVAYGLVLPKVLSFVSAVGESAVAFQKVSRQTAFTEFATLFAKVNKERRAVTIRVYHISFADDFFLELYGGNVERNVFGYRASIELKRKRSITFNASEAVFVATQKQELSNIF